jgi:tRNA threonylcarbamoyladenosine biosynthesis protein TsaB
VIVLGIEGALRSFSAAVAQNGRVLSYREILAKNALEEGLRCIARAVEESRHEVRAVGRIGVGVGPGSYTGVRIALSYAKSLSFAWRVPLVTISSYDLLEAGVQTAIALAIVEVKGGVICARFREQQSSRHACGAPREVLGRLLPSHPMEVPTFGATKDALDVLAERGVRVDCKTSSYAPAAAAALLAPLREPAPNAHAVSPDYGELPVAKVPHVR